MDEDLHHASTAIDLVYEAYLVESPDLDGSLEFSLENLCLLLGFVERVGEAQRAVKKQLQAAIARELGEGATYRLGNTIYRAAPSSRFVVDNGAAMMDWLGDDVREAFNPNYVKVGVLKALAVERGHDAQTIVDSFGHYEQNTDALSVVPIDKARQWEKRLPDGARSYPKGGALGDLPARI